MRRIVTPHPNTALVVGVEQELQSTPDNRMNRIAKYLDAPAMKANGKIVRIDFSSTEDGSQTVDISILEDPAFTEKSSQI